MIQVQGRPVPREESGPRKPAGNGNAHIAPAPAAAPRARAERPQLAANVVRRPQLRPPGADDRVVAVIAPSGYGKTTLALQWFEEISQKSAAGWLQIGERSRDPTDFLRQLDEVIGTGGGRDMNAFHGVEDQDAAIDGMVSAVRSRPRRQFLFIDDAHILAGSSAMRCFRQLMQCAPRNLVLVITSREAEELDLAAATLTGSVRWIAREQLVLSREEIGILGKQNGLVLASAELDAISSLTEGWPALTQLALFSMGNSDGRFLRESHAGLPVASYVHDRFLAVLGEPEREAIAILAILGETTLELLESMSSASSIDVLRRSERMGIVCRRAERGETPIFAMHPLIREEVLRRGPASVSRRRDIEKRAACWWWANGDPERAIRLALAAKMKRASREWLSIYAPVLVHGDGRHETFLDLLAAAERLWGERDAGMTSLAVSALMFLRRYPDAERLLGELAATEGYGEPEAPHARSRADSADWQRSVIAGLRDDYVAAGKFAQSWVAGSAADQAGAEPFHGGMAWVAIAFAQKCSCAFAEAGASLEKARTLMARAGSAYGMVWARLVAVLTLLKQGDFRELLAETDASAVELAGARAGIADLAALIQAAGALARYERGDFAQCQAALETALPRLHRQGVVDAMIAGYVAAARLQAARGQFSGALDVLAEGQRVGVERNFERLRVTLAAERATLLARHGAVREAHAAAKTSGLLAGQPRNGLQRDKSVRLFARLALAEGKPELIGTPLANALAHARATGQRYKIAELLIFEALRQRALGQTQAAFAALTESLEIGAAQGYLRLYIDEGEKLRALIRAMARLDTLPAPVAAALRRLLEDAPPPSSDAGPGTLSDREKEILILAGEGRSNHEIAQLLLLTEGTVKWHLHNLYGKLDVRSRTAAVHAARVAGLLT